jgi:hypothetical protein
MVSTNIVGNTKKTVVSAMLFVAYCVGNIVSPQVFLTAEEPRYPVRRERPPHRTVGYRLLAAGAQDMYRRLVSMV